MSVTEVEQQPEVPPEPGHEEVNLASGLTKIVKGLLRTWKLYRTSRMGLLGLALVLAFFFMAAFAPIISPYTTSFRAPSEDIFIADYANMNLTEKLNWTTPIGLTTPSISQNLSRVMVYSTEGVTKVFPVESGRSAITGGSGIVVGDPITRTLPPNLTYINYVHFPSDFQTAGNSEDANAFFFLLQGSVLREYTAGLADGQVQWTIPFVPKYHSNLFNGYTQISNTARMALVFANETTLWLIDKVPANLLFGIPLTTYTSNLTIPGAKIVSNPIVIDTDTFVGHASVVAVPTDIGLYVYDINVTETTYFGASLVTDVKIGDLLWKSDYRIAAGDVVAPIDSVNAVTFPDPAIGGGLFGKTSILLATTDGRIIAFNTFNGTIQYAVPLVMPTIRDYQITALYPSPRAVVVVGKTGTRGFIAGIDSATGAVNENKTAYSTTEGIINGPPTFVPGLLDFVYSTDTGAIYLTTETLKTNATFSAPSGGMVTPVGFLGNIYTSSAVTGNYFGAITAGNTVFIETLSGVNVAPLPPGTYPSGNRYILGTDYEGHDILTWLIYGTRAELLVGVSAALFAVVIGTIVGLVAGFYSGLVDDILMRATDVVLALPFIVIALLFASIFGPMLVNIIIIIAVLSWAGIARVIRSVTLSIKERSFVDAAIISGASDTRLIFRHIGPNVLPYTFLYMTFTVSGAIITEAILSFLGFGDPSNVTWGIMLSTIESTGHTLDAMWWLLPPGIAITLLSLAFYLIGRGFDTVVNPRLRRR